MSFLGKILSLGFFKNKSHNISRSEVSEILRVASEKVAAKKLVTGSRGLTGKELDDFFESKGCRKMSEKESREVSEMYKRAYLRSKER